MRGACGGTEMDRLMIEEVCERCGDGEVNIVRVSGGDLAT